MSNDTTVIWKDIPGYEGLYQVSNTGLVRTLRATHGRPVNYVMSPGNNRGYLAIGLTLNGIDKRFSIHRLVMLAFVGDRPDGMVTNHKNGIRDDNRLENLEYVTHRQNTLHMINVLNTYHRTFGAAVGGSKLDDDKVREIRRLFAVGGFTHTGLAITYQVSRTLIGQIIRRKIWKHVE